MAKLQIVWRNPNPVKHTTRWYTNSMFATFGAVRYVIEELVGDKIVSLSEKIKRLGFARQTQVKLYGAIF